MGVDRRVLAGLAAGAYAALVIGYGYDDDLPPALLLGSALAFSAALVWLLGRSRGALVALFVAAALNRYSAELGGATIKPEHVVAPLAALALLPDWRRLLSRLDLVAGLLLLWLAWSVVPGLLNAPDPGNSTRLWAMLVLASFGYFATVTTVRTAGRARTLVAAWLLVGIAVALFGIGEHVLYQVFDVDLGIQVNPVTRDPTIPGTFYEANLFGSATMMLAISGIALLAFSSRLTWLAWWAATAGTLAMQLSFTRTAWVAFVLGLLAIGVLRLFYPPRRTVARPAARTAWSSVGSMGAYLGVVAIGTVLLWGPLAGAQGEVVTAEVLPTPTVAPVSEPTPTPAQTPTPLPTLSALVVGTPALEQARTPVAAEADISGRVTSIGDTNDASLKLRMKFIRTALDDWKEHPIVGLGIGSFGQKYISSFAPPASPTSARPAESALRLSEFGQPVHVVPGRAVQRAIDLLVFRVD